MNLSHGSINIEITNVCNLDCIYYYNHLNRNIQEKKNEKINWGKVFEVVDSDIKYVNITGGEPSLVVNIDEFIKLFNSKILSISTNAIKRININSFIKKVVISIDGHEDVMLVHRGVRNNIYKKIIDNIYYYLSHDIDVVLNIVVTKYNLYKFSSFIKENIFSKDRVKYSIVVMRSTPRARSLALSSQSSLRYIFEQVENLIRHFDYHREISLNLYSKKMFIEHYSENFPNHSFITFNMQSGLFSYCSKQFDSLSMLESQYHCLASERTMYVLSMLNSYDDEFLFIPPSGNEIEI